MSKSQKSYSFLVYVYTYQDTMYNELNIYLIERRCSPMADALGQQLLIDLYACDEDTISSATSVQESVATAFDLAEHEVDEISCQVMDDEIILIAIAPKFHLCLHTYPALGYVAGDMYSFENEVPLTLMMKALRKSFRAEKVKATSVQRADFGNERDMKPRRQTKITTLGRVSRTRIQLKQTGKKLKSQSAKVFKVIAKKDKGQKNNG